MVIGAVLSLGLALLVGGSGLWSLTRPPVTDLTGQVVRMVAPTQVAAGVMLAAGGVLALTAGPRIGLIALIVGAFGAIGTVLAGSLQGARYAARREATVTGCGSSEGCGGCSQVCER